MIIKRVGALALAATAVLTVSGCTGYYDDYGYGYGRPSYGYNYQNGYNVYRQPGYSYGYPSGYGGGYATPYSYGWYGDYYYPGTGVYIYNRSGTRYQWNRDQQRYWQSRRGNYRGGENWSGYGQRNGVREGDRQRRYRR